jgi:hypothetical protein
MGALRKLFANGHSTPALTFELEIALNDVVREAEELRCLLRKRREDRSTAKANPHKGLSDA